MGARKLLFLKEFFRKPTHYIALGCGPATMPARSSTAAGPARGMAQSGSASALGAEGRGFESLCPDQFRGGPNWSDGIHFLPETWETPWPRRGLGPGSTRDMADANPRTAGVPRRYVLWWAVGYNARPRTRCARIPGIDLIIRLARGLFDHRARSSTG